MAVVQLECERNQTSEELMLTGGEGAIERTKGRLAWVVRAEREEEAREREFLIESASEFFFKTSRSVLPLRKSFSDSRYPSLFLREELSVLSLSRARQGSLSER